MNNDKGRTPAAKPPSAPATPAPKAPTPSPPPKDPSPSNVRPAPLFRRIDWLTLLITFAVVWIGYYLTIAPEMTLEDSGELATGSFYAGIPHPPGYPVWTIYTWLWTVLLPVGNVAWRVALAEATGGALAAGLLAMLVSRGSSLLMEGIEELKAMAGRWQSAICIISGFVAGLLIGFNGFMWSQSVIVEVYSFSVASLMVVLLCLLRWIYAPHQRRYLYLALFFHGICFTNHQTLIVAAMGIEAAIAAASFRMGRNLFLGNTILFFGGLILKGEHILTALDQNFAVFVIFIIVGICSIVLYGWFAILTKETFPELCLDVSMAAFCLLVVAIPSIGIIGVVLAIGAAAGWVYYARLTWKLGWEWLVVIICGFCWIAGAGFYFYMPLAGMSNPPMEWGYPRTVEGFFHAFTRGQYEKTTPTDIFHDPGRFITQLSMLGRGIIEEFNWVYAFLALVPFLFFFKLHRRERSWLVGLTSIYLCLGVLLLILLNPPPDRAAQELVRVFFTASHTIISILIGYGLTLIAAFMATHYERFRSWGIIGAGAALALALISFTENIRDHYFGETAPTDLGQIFSIVGQSLTDKYQYGLPVYAELLLIGIAAVFLGALWFYRQRAPLAITLGLFALMPLHSIMSHWADNEERNHWFGYWFGHDMFTPPFKGSDGKPLYPEMTGDAVLFGGTDPGRFAPTYMIFCDSFIPHKCLPPQDQNFDRRDVYIITQNALADGTYLEYIRAQYNRSTQIDPPFFQELVRSDKERADNYGTNMVARMAQPLDRLFEGLGAQIERRRRTYTSWFQDKDFVDLRGFVTRLQPGPQQDLVSKYLYDNLTAETRTLLTGNAAEARLRSNLAHDLNHMMEKDLEDKTHPLYSADRFKQVQLSEYLQDFIKQNPQSDTRVRLDRLLLEAAYPREVARTLGGVYPDREIYTPTSEDLSKSFNDYMLDAQRRYQHDVQSPNEPRQIKPGENVALDEKSGRISISGQIAVMSINALLCRVIFDHNPKNEFFVEESFPLDWMYPYETPFGVIMKINRRPLPELTEDIVRRDHEFWSQYSQRLIGNWITYDTPIKDIAAWVEKVYLRRNFRGFTGDQAFIRDDQAQKAFSKLRSSIAGMYNWRVMNAKPGSADYQRMLKEADFAFRQAFAFCPYSPEAVFRYTNLLLSQQRFEDAYLIASTCLKLDPYNSSVIGLVNQLDGWRKQKASMTPEQMEQALTQHPEDFQAGFNLASAYLQSGQTGKAVEILDRLMNSPRAEPNVFRALVQAYSSLGDTNKLEAVADKLISLRQANPSNTEATVVLGETYRVMQKSDLATQTLQQALDNPKLDANAAMVLAQQYVALADYPHLESALEKLAHLAPTSPEAWYDLAALKASLGKNSEALAALKHALDLNAQRLKQNPNSPNLINNAQTDPRFAALRQSPEFKQMTGQK